MTGPAYATVNPCRACQPLGTILAFRGIEGAMVLLHGSQGCSTYMRLYLTRHFREPCDVASSALNEKDTVYGGAANLEAGLRNLLSRYDPDVVGVSSTCLAETIGDDLEAILRNFSRDHETGVLPHLVPVSTPSFEGSATEGFGSAVHALVRVVARNSGNGKAGIGQINIFIGNVSSSDASEVKRLLSGSGAPCALIPDVSETFDAPLNCELPLIPAGGTPLRAVEASGSARASLTLGWERSLHLAGHFLEAKHRVPAHFAPLPVGLTLTDRFLAKLWELAGCSPMDEEVRDRGRLLDALADCHRLTYGRRVAIYGEPDLAFGLVHLALEMGIRPVLAATGSPDTGFVDRVRALLDTAPGAQNGLEAPATIIADADFRMIEETLTGARPDLLLGHSHGAGLAERLGVPLVRVGFPVYDRFGAQRLLHLGYRGAIRLVDEIVNALLEGGRREGGRRD